MANVVDDGVEVENMFKVYPTALAKVAVRTAGNAHILKLITL